MNRKRQALLIGGLLILFGIGICLVLSIAGREVIDTVTTADNTPGYFWRFHGADVSMLSSLSNQYRVSIEDFPKFGRRPFPINYIRYRTGWLDGLAKLPLALRRDVDPLIKGFVSRCQIGNTISHYLFYSDRLVLPNILTRGPSALVMEVRYRLDPNINEIRDDQILEDISHVRLGEDSPWVWENIAPACIPPARTH